MGVALVVGLVLATVTLPVRERVSLTNVYCTVEEPDENPERATAMLPALAVDVSVAVALQ